MADTVSNIGYSQRSLSASTLSDDLLISGRTLVLAAATRCAVDRSRAAGSGGRHYSDRLCSDRRYSDNPQSGRPSTVISRNWEEIGRGRGVACM